MDTAVTTARWAKLALTVAGIITATVLGLAIKVGRDMATYFATATVLTSDAVIAAPGASTPAHASVAPRSVVVTHEPASPTPNGDAATPQANRSVATAP
ncbi:hypothetical protein [Lysobacter sp. P5_B9]